MSAFVPHSLAEPRASAKRPLAVGTGVGLAAAILFLARHIAPQAPAGLGFGLAALAGLAVIALAFTLDDEALARLTEAAAAGVGLIVAGALADPEARLRLMSFASAAFGVGLAAWLARTARQRPRVSFGLAALFAAALAGLSAYAAILVLMSRDLMIADFMTYRGIAVMIARLADAGNWPLLMSATAESIAQDYSWAPALVPGLALAIAWPTSRALFTFALLALYAAPALLALAMLARDLARRAGLRRLPSPRRLITARSQFRTNRGAHTLLREAGKVARRASKDARPSTGYGVGWGAESMDESVQVRDDADANRLASRRWATPHRALRATFPSGAGEGELALGVAAVFAAFPAAMAVAARGMPDVGGLVLAVCALRLAERLARLIALPKGHDALIAPMTRRVALALALTLFAMFAFRRWYAFAAAGTSIMLAIEVLSIALKRGARFRWKDAVAAAALGALALIALTSPVIVDWLPNLGAHDYVDVYAAYRKPPDVFLRQLADWVGLIPALAALGSAAFLWARSPNRRLLRLTLSSAGVAAALFLRVQTPYIHHLDLIAPATAAPIAASLMLVFARAPRAALLGLAGLSLLTLSPLASALNPLGLAPIAGLPRAPRADLDELERLKDWVDRRARPDAKVCGLGSSYTFSGQLIEELWQLHRERVTGPSEKTGVKMPDVDEVDGPPTSGLRDCAIIIVGDPVQTHLDPDHQQTVVVPSREMLTGQGIGAKFRRTGQVFHLEKGVSAVVFERLAPLDDADIAALQQRWRAARAAVGFDETSGRR
jgi:hypothetical protein